ncbi:PCI domain-containing protein [Pholiota molesta]|nr:PCI domain-containing protein [Pholiota molesta]
MANTTDSVSIFAEGTFEEQIFELLSYIGRNRSEDERASFVAPFQNALKPGEGKKPLDEDEPRRKLILSKLLQEVRGLGDGTDREIEGFYNLLFAHTFSLYPPTSPEAKQYITNLLKTISASPSERLSVKYRMYTLIQIATSKDDLDVLELTKSDVEKWLSEWEISPEEKSAFLKSIVDAYVKAEQPTIAYEYSLLYLQSLPSSSEQAKEAAVDVVATALRLPTVFDFDALFKLDAVVAIKEHELFSLLQIFLSGGLPEFKAWASSHPETLEKHPSELERKIRLLTLASLAFKHIGQNLSYSKVAEALQVDPLIIRAGLVWGKLSQTTQISTSLVRRLEKRLLAWKAGLADILEVVANAKKQGGVAA